MTRFAIPLLVILLTPAMAPAQVTGTPTVIDGETLVVAGRQFRLTGIDAPDLAQTCRIRNRSYGCGRVSRTALMDLVAGVRVRCIPVGGAAGTTAQARCFADGYDLSEGMVYTGWALAMPRQNTRYARIEGGARKARRGLWQGPFVPPWQWRAGQAATK